MSAAHDYYEDPFEVQQRLIAEMNADHVAAMREMDAEDAIDQAAYQRVADDNAAMDRLIAEMSADNAAFDEDDAEDDDSDEEGDPVTAGSPAPLVASAGRGWFRF